MAKRRKFLAGLGALASGSAAAVGTGAFTSVRADREVSISVAPDNNAYLQLEELETAQSESFINDSGGRPNTISISIGETDGGGQGVNEQAVTFIDDLFLISNQGRDPVWIWM